MNGKSLGMLAAVTLLGAPTALNACEPIVPFFQVVAGPAALTHSLVVLVWAVLLKSLAFARWQKKITPLRAFMFMFIGNLLTTVIGFVAGAMIGSGGGALWILGVPIVFGLCYVPSKRLVAAAPYPVFAGKHPAAVAIFMTGGLLVSCVLFGFAQFDLMMGSSIPAYWVGKVVAVYLALIVSLALTAFWEEWVVWRLSRSPANESGFAQPVIRANLLALLIVMLVSAGFMLPKRLQNWGFLAPMAQQ
jgi:hypothetical protein